MFLMWQDLEVGMVGITLSVADLYSCLGHVNVQKHEIKLK